MNWLDWIITVCGCITAACLVLTTLYLSSAIRVIGGKPMTWWERLIRSPRDGR